MTTSGKTIGALILLLLLAITAAASTPLRRALDPATDLMESGQWAEAAHALDSKIQQNPDDHDAHLRRAICAINLKDYPRADKGFATAVKLDPTRKPQVARVWREEGMKALTTGRTSTASALFAKAVYFDPSLAKGLGMDLVRAADIIKDDVERARLLSRATDWVGAQEVFEASGLYYKRKFGPARQVFLENPGWAELSIVKPGDEILYLAPFEIRQKDKGTIRILPPAIEAPIRLTFEHKDMGGQGSTKVWLARHRTPARAYIWIIPASRK
jgi:tetratricopeptide (TPR) repeat protein